MGPVDPILEVLVIACSFFYFSLSSVWLSPENPHTFQSAPSDSAQAEKPVTPFRDIFKQ